MFWKKKKVEKAGSSKIVLGMIIIRDNNSFDPGNFAVDFRSHYGKKISSPSGDHSSMAFTVDGETVVIAHMPVPIPCGDLKQTASFAYNWVNALEDTSGHQSHLIISVIQGSNSMIQRFRIFTHVLASLLRTTNSIGVYQGSQSLLTPKDDFLTEASLMGDDYLPLNLWIYIGLRSGDRGNSGYTYGLKEFGKPEMEILNSNHDLEEVRDILFNMAHYVLEYDVNFKDGETCGVSQDEKIAISFSEGVFVEGRTYKLAF